MTKTTRRPWLLSLLLALRPSQWTKNALVFAAFIFALGDKQQTISISLFWTVAQAAGLFCLLSSSVYIFNDLWDLPLDRQHPIKKNRPIASGAVSRKAATATGLVLLVVSLTLCGLLSIPLLAIMGGYFVLQVFYTLGLKRIALVDLFVIATGFVLRALAGAVVLQVDISAWLLLCTLLLALFLALCKRRQEKTQLAEQGGETRPSLNEYDERLLDQLIAIVSSATVVSYALYTLWPDTVAKFGTTHLGFTIPFVLFGLFRYLDLVYRHSKGGQPEKILLTDIPLIIDLILYGACVLFILL